jgi:hypothetical protein
VRAAQSLPLNVLSLFLCVFLFAVDCVVLLVHIVMLHVFVESELRSFVHMLLISGFWMSMVSLTLFCCTGDIRDDIRMDVYFAQTRRCDRFLDASSADRRALVHVMDPPGTSCLHGRCEGPVRYPEPSVVRRRWPVSSDLALIARGWSCDVWSEVSDS